MKNFILTLSMAFIFTACASTTSTKLSAEEQYNYGLAYIEAYDGGDSGGDGEQNYYKGMQWWRKAAEQGHAEAQYELGHAYYYGGGFAPNYEKALQWFRKAAEQGHAEAQNKLGFAYYHGNGVKQSKDTACEWWRKAAIHIQVRSYADLRNKSGADHRVRKYC